MRAIILVTVEEVATHQVVIHQVVIQVTQGAQAIAVVHQREEMQ